jgi:Zn-dependent metalloprotease
MSNPNLFEQPAEVGGAYYADPSNIANDYGGVHKNSGIINRAAYLMFQSGQFTKPKLAKLWYRSLSRLNPTSEFLDCRYAVLATARIDNMSDAQKNDNRVGGLPHHRTYGSVYGGSIA